MPFQPPCSSELVHYQVAELALMMESMVIVGGNARTLAMIQAFKSLLQTTPVLSGPSLRDVNSKVFEELIDENFNFLRRGREPSTGMTYVKEVLVRRVAALLSSGGDFRVSEDGSFIPLEKEKKQGALEVTESPLTLSSDVENSLLAGDPREVSLKVLAGIEKELRLSIKSIVEDRSIPLISSNDTIMVFGRSSTVELILLGAANNPRLGVKPRVIVVDAAPLYEGRALAKRLTTSGLSVTYGLITSCCTLMPHCTRVFIGAAAVLQNGDVFSRCGTAVVVASAKQYRKPVLCFSESFKFISEVWLGNLGQNTQLQFSQSLPGDHRIRSPGGMSPPRHQNREINEQPFGRSNDGLPMQSSASSASGYLYDLTPAAFIDMIICEMGCLDTSAIVAALRDREDRDACLMSVA
ncbi:translation initiation factor eIF2B delta subunit [Trypanosoma cruzi Dm28c]|uniref:Translation initiation factor eIF2B subunit delta n=2 Tax=Trypanosoma cruzi TaxID=5693 RepID=V5BHQ4_TRYCR|nr:translation initiation factor eIF2B delta subunit [Trypanosoma cruzi Dm28c]